MPNMFMHNNRKHTEAWIFVKCCQATLMTQWSMSPSGGQSESWHRIQVLWIGLNIGTGHPVTYVTGCMKMRAHFLKAWDWLVFFWVGTSLRLDYNSLELLWWVFFANKAICSWTYETLLNKYVAALQTHYIPLESILLAYKQSLFCSILHFH